MGRFGPSQGGEPEVLMLGELRDLLGAWARLNFDNHPLGAVGTPSSHLAKAALFLQFRLKSVQRVGFGRLQQSLLVIPDLRVRQIPTRVLH